MHSRPLVLMHQHTLAHGYDLRCPEHLLCILHCVHNPPHPHSSLLLLLPFSPPFAIGVCPPPTSHTTGHTRLSITVSHLLSGWKDGHMTHTWPIMALYHLVFGDWPKVLPCDLVEANQLSSMKFDVWTREESISTSLGSRPMIVG